MEEGADPGSPLTERSIRLLSCFKSLDIVRYIESLELCFRCVASTIAYASPMEI